MEILMDYFDMPMYWRVMDCSFMYWMCYDLAKKQRSIIDDDEETEKYEFAPIIYSHLRFLPLSFLHEARKIIRYTVSEYDDPQDVLVNSVYRSFDVSTINTMEETSMGLMLCNESPAPKQYITHMFVHSSWQHMFNNLSNCYFSGRTCYRYFQSNLMIYGLFLSGGVIAAMPSPLHESYRDDWINSWTANRIGINMPHIGALAVKKVLSVIPLEHSCGSSGGVSALMGAALVFTLKDVKTMYNTIVYPEQYQHETNYSHSRIGRELHRTRRVSTLLQMAMSAVSIAKFFVESATATASSNRHTSTITEGTRVAHAAHIQGGIYGMLTSIVWLLIKSR